MKIYHCEDSLEGIFTAIYNTYEDHCICLLYTSEAADEG